MDRRVRGSRRRSRNSLQIDDDDVPSAHRVPPGTDDLEEHFFHVLFAGPLAQFGQGALGQQPAAMDDPDAVADLFDLVHHVRGVDHRLPPRPAFLHEADDRAGRRDIEPEGRLVKDHDRRIVHQRARDRGLLLHAGREVLAAAVEELVHVQFPRQAFQADPNLGQGESVQLAEIGHDLAGGQAPVQGRAGRQKPHLAPHGRGRPHDVVAGDDRGSAGRLEEGRQEPHDGRLAGPVCAQETVDLARLDGE